MSNVKEMSDAAASRSLEVLKQISSTGYLRKRLPQELVVFNGGIESAMTSARTAAAVKSGGDGAALRTTRVSAASTTTLGATAATRARMQGFEGEACGECGNYTLVRNGTCMKCNTCGATSGCS